MGQKVGKKIEVVAYSGYKANERPLYFILEQEKFGVVNLVDRWYGTENDYFKVLAQDGKIYLIRWNRLLDEWFVVKIMDKTETPQPAILRHRPIDS